MNQKVITRLLATGEDLKIEEELWTKVNRIVFENLEMERKHNPYDEEEREVASIEKGDEESFLQSIAESYSGTLGQVAKDPVRNARNLAIIVITLACRAAIRGGVNPEVAFSMSDAQVQKCEMLEDADKIERFKRICELMYLRMVKEQKSALDGSLARSEGDSAGLHIEACKYFIFHHLHDKITVKEIAAGLYLNPDYLSGMFKKKTGMTITEYIQREKVKLAGNMLIYSSYTYTQIAAYLGFSSQSHLGTVFKKRTGMTLRAYREKNAVRQFRT